MAYKLVGKDYTPPDIEAKVTGAAKYSEDFRAEGMVFAKLLLSPMPHAKVRSIDTSKAAKIDGVIGFLTADEVPDQPVPRDPILTNEPMYYGQAIMGVAAVTEEIAANAIDAIKIDIQPLGFVTDPLDSLFPGGPKARTDGNALDVARREVHDVNWSAQDFLALQDGQLPLGTPLLDWEVGDVAAGFAKSALVLDESFVTAGTAHHCMEPRGSFAYWQGGKCYLHGGTQSTAGAVPSAAGLIGLKPEEVVFIGEYCGGGFGSKVRSYPTMSIAAHFSKKIGRPVMLRLTRHEEYYVGVGRPGFQGRVKMGFRDDGKVNAIDLFIVNDNGPNRGGGDYRSAAAATHIVYQPESMHFRGIAVLTNTPPRGAQRGPGTNQAPCFLEPIVDKAARELGIDRIAIRAMNAPGPDGKIANSRSGKLGAITSSFLPEALAMGSKQFDFSSRIKRSGQANGTKVTGIGVASCYHGAGSSGYDGLIRIATDGHMHIHSGCGNLGTYSLSSTARVAAEVLDIAWENCTVVGGRSENHLPWTESQAGSKTVYTSSRRTYVAAMDAKTKLQEIAAKDLGGAPGDYELKGGAVVGNGKTMTLAQAAKRAIQLGGKYDGHELPEDINPMTTRSAQALAGSGLIAVAKDTLPKKGNVPGLVVGFAEVEVDTETGVVDIIDYLAMNDVGTVLHPQGLSQQSKGGGVHGFGMALQERHVYDPKLGTSAAVGFHNSKLPTYLDQPKGTFEWAAVGLPDPSNPMGGKGVGEPAQGAAAAAILSAVSDALGGHLFNRAPIVSDMIVNHYAGRPQSTRPLAQNTQ